MKRVKRGSRFYVRDVIIECSVVRSTYKGDECVRYEVAAECLKHSDEGIVGDPVDRMVDAMRMYLPYIYRPIS